MYLHDLILIFAITSMLNIIIKIILGIAASLHKIFLEIRTKVFYVVMRLSALS